MCKRVENIHTSVKKLDVNRQIQLLYTYKIAHDNDICVDMQMRRKRQQTLAKTVTLSTITF